MISYLRFLPALPGQRHMTSTVHHTILLFIYKDRLRSIFGGSVVFSFDVLKLLFVLFPVGLCTCSFLPLLPISQTEILGISLVWEYYVLESVSLS